MTGTVLFVLVVWMIYTGVVLQGLEDRITELESRRPEPRS